MTTLKPLIHTASQKPSHKPTLNPTSSSPTFNPTLSELSLWKLKYENLNKNITNSFNSILYRELMYNGEYIYGGCNEWQTFIGGTLLEDTSRIIKSISLITLINLNEIISKIECNNEIKCNEIINNLLNINIIENSTSCLNFNINNNLNETNNWIINGKLKCNSKTNRILIQNNNNKYLISPCLNNCNSYTNKTNFIHILEINYRPYEPAPIITINKNNIIIGRTNITLLLSLNNIGTIYCSSYINDYDINLITINNIILQNNKIIITSNIINNTISLNLFNLLPFTNYNIYCLSISKDNINTDIITILNNKININTLCCKQIIPILKYKNVYINEIQSNILELKLDSKPLYKLNIHISLNNNNNLQNIFYPSIITILPIDNIINKIYYISWTGNINILGNRTINILLLNENNENYNLYNNDKYEIINNNNNLLLNIIDHTMPPSIPILLEAIFNNDGSYIELKFDSNTNKNNQITNIFQCNDLLLFINNSIATCLWKDNNNNIIIIYPGQNSLLTINSIITLKENKLKAQCTTLLETCKLWNYIPLTILLIKSPEFPIIPNVIISSPNIINICDNLILDLSNSIGNGGRNWINILFKVTSNNININITKLQQIEYFLNNEYIISPPTPILSKLNLLEIGNKYYFTVKLCNFLLGCSESSILTVNVVSYQIPTVNILGSLQRTILRKSILQLNSDAYTINCNSNSDSNIENEKSYRNLIYTWKLLDNNNIEILNILSDSKDITKYILKSYSLLSSITYIQYN